MSKNLRLDSENERSHAQPLILAVDDDEDNLFLLSYVLDPAKYAYIGETDSQTGLSIAKERLPDLILLDVVLPGMDGIEFVGQLRQDPQTRHIPVIAVTGLASEENREELLAAGFNDYITKPYLIEDLEAAIYRLACPLSHPHFALN